MTHPMKARSRTTHFRTFRSLRCAAGLGLGLLSLLSVSAAHAGTVNWDGTVADWFANPTHWDNGGYPGAGDDAVNMSTAAMTLGQSTTVNSFFSNGAFSLQGGQFSGNQANSASTLTVNNVFTVDGGQINNFTVNQGTGGSLVFTGNGNNSINNSIINSSIDMATSSNAFLNVYGNVTVNGAITLGTSNSIQLVDIGASPAYASTLTLGSAGSLTGFGAVSQYYSNTLTNNGTINANSSANALNLGVSQFNNSGTAEATKGATLAFNSTNVANNGTISADGAGSIAALTGNITGGANSLFTATNGGQIQVNGAQLLGTINTDANTALVFNGNGGNNINGGTAIGTTTTINGNLDLATNTNAFLNVYGNVTENGNINLGTTSNGIQLVDIGASPAYAATLTLGSAGSLTGFGAVSQYYSNTLTNNGTINANVGGQTLTIGTSNFNNSGRAEATNGGTLALNNNTNASDGSTLAATGPGSIVSITGTYTGAGTDLITASGGGQVQVNGAQFLGTINTDASTALVFNGNGANNLNGTTVNGNLDLATNTNAFLNVNGNVTENGNINLGTTSNGIQLVNITSQPTGASTLTLGSGGSLTGFGAVSQYYSNTLTNNGTVNANVGGQTLNINTSNFNNVGTAEVQNGAALIVQSANTDSGNVLVHTGGTATFSQGLTQTAGLTQADGTLNSPLTLTGGTLAGTGTVNGAVTNTSGTVSAGNSASPFGTLAVSGALSQNSGGAMDVNFNSTQNSLLAVTGTVTTGGTLNVNYLGSGVNTNFAPFTFLDYGSLGTEPTNALGFTQYFANETAINDNLGLIVGSDGFTYDLINNTSLDALQLQVITNGGPNVPSVPEASTNVSLGALLLLGGAGVWRAKRRRAVAAD